MNFLLTRLCWPFIPGYNRSGRLTKALTLRWPLRYLPTRPERLANPESSNKWLLQTYPPATTKVLARNSTSPPPSRAPGGGCDILPPARPWPRRPPAGRGNTSTRPALRNASQVKSGEYLAPIGQTGVQVSLRQQAGRPR